MEIELPEGKMGEMLRALRLPWKAHACCNRRRSGGNLLEAFIDFAEEVSHTWALAAT
jgi:hypothetical protein